MDANEQKAHELLYAETAKAYAEPFGGPIIQHDIAIRAIMAALAQQVPADGEWVLVPRDPTPGMLHFVIGDPHSEGQAYYAAMLAAAPQAPQPIVEAELCVIRC